MENICRLVTPLHCRGVNMPAPGQQLFQIGMNDLAPGALSELNPKLPGIPAFPGEKPCPRGLHGKSYGGCCQGKGAHGQSESRDLLCWSWLL